MSHSNINLTKTCSNCGLQKPLSAFLELSGSEGAIYGNICNTCRKTIGKKQVEESEMDTDTGMTIDTRAKVKGFKDRKQQLQDKIDKAEEAEKKLEEKVTKQTQNTQQISTDKKTRETTKKPWESGDKSARVSTQTVFGGEQHAAKEATIDLATGPVQDTQIAGKLKHQGVYFKALKDWLPKSAALASKIDAPQSPTTEKKESLIETAKKNWGPKK